MEELPLAQSRSTPRESAVGGMRYEDSHRRTCHSDPGRRDISDPSHPEPNRKGETLLHREWIVLFSNIESKTIRKPAINVFRELLIELGRTLQCLFFFSFVSSASSSLLLHLFCFKDLVVNWVLSAKTSELCSSLEHQIWLLKSSIWEQANKNTGLQATINWLTCLLEDFGSQTWLVWTQKSFPFTQEMVIWTEKIIDCTSDIPLSDNDRRRFR
jgi:hypothetical protein